MRDLWTELLGWAGYEHPWMMACPEQSRYSKDWLASLSETRKDFFHASVFEPALERYV